MRLVRAAIARGDGQRRAQHRARRLLVDLGQPDRVEPPAFGVRRPARAPARTHRRPIADPPGGGIRGTSQIPWAAHRAHLDARRAQRVTCAPRMTGDLRHAVRIVRQRRGAPRQRRVRQRRGVSRLHRIQRRSRGARLSRHLRRRASLHRLRPGLGDAEPADLARRAHPHAAARHRGDRAALAQSRAAGRTGGDARPAVRRAARFRHRQGLPLQRIRRLRRADGGSRCAVRGMRSRCC